MGRKMPWNTPYLLKKWAELKYSACLNQHVAENGSF